MHLKIEDVEIENEHLTKVFWSSSYLIFAGVALDMDGKRICSLLSKFKEGQIVKVKAELETYEHYEGICKIVKIEFPPPTLDKAPAIYRFGGYLEPVR